MESMTCPSSCSVALRYLVRWHGGYPRTFPPAPKSEQEVEQRIFLYKNKQGLNGLNGFYGRCMFLLTEARIDRFGVHYTLILIKNRDILQEKRAK